ncbi:DHS-like NAD/FAD-binding domain-containing protein [Choiromyces venosus 120613-1]|uniref:DHS-like NAD/FAD-binding domain-containing protein n=1 Tax=Choiromyces venosus 120613-1 TaxID=1336337 RepID=A0A3N4JWT5_9PEZI|nr:DHS-like NAD/FAD-binding domain-containing protein [Choiromyces venosus 120613-1]
MALCGAGLSAASGLPTFRGVGGMWRNYEATMLATPEAFEADPSLVWQFYSMRRHMALRARPNAAHFALAELARRKGADGEFRTVTQNVDGLSARANHPPETIDYLHGHLFDVKCSSQSCDYKVQDFSDPIIPEFAVPLAKASLSQRAPGPEQDGQGEEEVVDGEELVYDESAPLEPVPVERIPECPKCNNLLRPGVVWFGEALDEDILLSIDWWIDTGIDLCIVIGTSGNVIPAAGYPHEIRSRGGKVAIVDLDVRAGAWRGGRKAFDWIFEGDASTIVPQLLKPLVGEITMPIGDMTPAAGGEE